MNGLFLFEDVLQVLDKGRAFAPSNDDERFLGMALMEARRSMGRTFPNPPVGCVVVNEGKVVGKGHHQKAGRPHAEVFALRDAGENAAGGTLYVTLEPCSHQGATPPCADAVIKAKVARVVVGVVDPNPSVKGQGIERMRAAGIEVGVCEGAVHREASAMISAFRKRIEDKRPYVIAKVAATLDGKIAMHNGHSQWVTGEKSRQVVHSLRDRVDAVLVGSGTVLADNPALTVRNSLLKPLVPQTQPRRVALDGALRSSPSSHLYRMREDDRAAPLVVHREDAAEKSRVSFDEAKIDRLSFSAEEHVPIEEMLVGLAQQNLTSVLVEPGPNLLRAFLLAGVIDELWWFVAPKLAGADGHPAVGDLQLNAMSDAVNLESAEHFSLGVDQLWVTRL
ncbi:MAG: bifunctional diaminohydroxyphosphoribosylaminopyrimidine deaminase/5-amino-6-(5-phosphoribosylamino)uracil reductase RibD [Deltaproteobacteria bacterium]|nr:bifunctional diaminohydroxyphosphoribosylaminopyrimidine deaminase/5-amino-6-(5-phosphoribosylamino)uracil reductase RibD [Deltaproteobacteria bacterium]